jgi:peptidoglycan/LPS O-acetylase OafA/YrhL
LAELLRSGIAEPIAAADPPTHPEFQLSGAPGGPLSFVVRPRVLKMKSSGGDHYVALDHVRAMAAFMVFTWHFIHFTSGYPVSFNNTPAFFPTALLDEGHTGVSLFMTLSGYLFVKLLDGKRIVYHRFLYNRILRLLPLMLALILVALAKRLVSNGNTIAYLKAVATGMVLPTLPNGGWSITVEFHFYVILPFLMYALRSRYPLGFVLLLSAIALRVGIYLVWGEVQDVAYWTIVGRFDQFLLGMLAYQHRSLLRGRHAVVVFALLGFTLFYTWFDWAGGFYRLPSSANSIWIILPTIEGTAYGIAIAYYDSSFSPSRSGLSAAVGWVGTYSYSIYLLHFFVVFRAARFVDTHVMSITNFYLATLWSFVCFVLFVPIAGLSYHIVEVQFLRFRVKYTQPAKPPSLIASDPKAGVPDQ